MNQNIKNNTLLLIIGVHKSGTTSLYDYLLLHNDVHGGTKKEIHHYTPLRYNNNILPFSDYIQEFANNRGEQYFLDASPSYFYGGDIIASRIKKELKNVKLLLILRNPAERFISFYKFLMSQYRLGEDVTLSKFIEESYNLKDSTPINEPIYRAYIEGCYANFINDWIKIFGKDLKIIFFDDIKLNIKYVLIDICEHLSINSNIYNDEINFIVSNKTRMTKYKYIHKFAMWINNNAENYFRKHPEIKRNIREYYYHFNSTKNTAQDKILDSDIKRLKDLYRVENNRLANILRINDISNLPSWLQDN